MADPYFIQSLTVAGFRAYLRATTFDFSKKRCLALFAPNGSGKSSIIDAIEFVLSKEGSLERLGQRAIHNQAGPAALVHNCAEQTQIEPKVTLSVISGKTMSQGERPASGAQRPMPEVAASLNACLMVPPIVRGHELRSFVEQQSPQDRYADVAGWLHLGPLVEVQSNIRALRAQVRTEAENQAPLREVDARLERETSKSLKVWDETAVLSYVNAAILAPLDPELSFSRLSDRDTAYGELATRASAEEGRIGLAGLRQLRSAAVAVWSVASTNVASGAIPLFEAAVAELAASILKETEERRKAANSVFQSLWQAAEPIFSDEAPTQETCPLCATPLLSTVAGSAEGVRAHIHSQLERLRAYAAAKQSLETARSTVMKQQTLLTSVLASLIGLIDEKNERLRTDLSAYKKEVAMWQDGELPKSTSVAQGVSKLSAQLDTLIAGLQQKQTENTYIKAKLKLDRLLGLKNDYEFATRVKSQLRGLSDSLAGQSSMIANVIREKVQSMLDGLRIPMNAMYSLIQGPQAPPIRLDLPAEEEVNQQRLNLLIDFADNRKGVPPSGYLSDSQIHSVALALRLAAIKQFNVGAPILALDDIVTSYDADHRLNIVTLIAQMFDESQVILTTHDERFFCYLKDRIGSKNWHFRRIVGIDSENGPRFADHRVTDQMIEARWADGLSAANEMRQAEEEWLLAICRGFGVSVKIREIEKAYSYERSELASALESFLKDRKLTPAPTPGVNNRFLSSLANGAIENFGSHFQETPYGSGSIGDEKMRWAEFTCFKNQFSCKKCGRTSFERPFSLKKPLCRGCQTPFEFTPGVGLSQLSNGVAVTEAKTT